ncbi:MULTISPECIES: DUF1214 domain-containing protein [Nonomuraea]|uniref:DUF1214 domain-containing protein n=1 Tax=Nonomuraea ferruginea TaxID=46174 RepID=A0ABT4T9J4_9ACTN|nr:DUF1214 domain-containing protein [Nonomuraea ferruginea]MDA0646179.1 DUF1214 domain-containing protein [Nonomuraea ferruginea]
MEEIERMADALEAWRRFVRALDEAGETVAGLAGPDAGVDVAEGFRYVLHVLADQVDRAGTRDSGRPLFLPGVTPVRKLFFDNPDTEYDIALISSRRSYRIRGDRGTVPYLAFCVYGASTGDGRPTRVTNLNDERIAFGPDGSFEITLSPEARPGTWIPLAPGAHTVIARQYFLDRARDRPARFTIEALDDPGPDPVFDDARFVASTRSAAAFVTAATRVARQRAEQAEATPNRFVEHRGHGLYGTPDAGYVICWYSLEPDQALVVEARPPRCRYWGVHLANRWGQSLDHRSRTTALNARSATLAPDGTLRVVVAHADPGEPNWLDTAGHPRGWVLFRWLLTDDVVIPEARVVPHPARRTGPGGPT